MVPPKHRLLRFTTLFTSTRSSAVRVGGLGSIFYQEIFRTGFTAIGTGKSPNSGFCGGALTRLDDNVGGAGCHPLFRLDAFWTQK